MSDPLALFPAFCARLKIASKDYGEIPLRLNGCQREWVRQVRRAIAQDRRWIITLKGRQQGLSTISLALDLFWPAKYPSIQGGLITESDDNKEKFRTTLQRYHDSLPSEAKFPVRKHNRTQLILGNGSRISYAVAGTKMKRGGGGLAQGDAYNYAHFTEVSSYGDQEDLERSLGSVLSDNFPHRLYIFESTAKGYNAFYDMWMSAKKSRTQAAIFIPWWLKEEYRATGAVLEVYGGYALDSDEARWVGEVKRLYGYVIDESQLAWWRWKLNEVYNGNLNLMLQEYPPTEYDAFQHTGSAFFSAEKLTKAMKRLKAEEAAPKCYRYAFGIDAMDVRVSEAPPGNAHLRIWRDPVEGATYVLGCDPAYGSSEWADQFCIQVYRCYADKLEQVAEFATAAMVPVTFAWVILHLASYFNSARLNIELNGPGTNVFQEIDNIKKRKQDFAQYMTGGNKPLSAVLSHIGMYLYRRLDSLTHSYALHTKMSDDVKGRAMYALQNAFELDGIIVRSPELLKEMRNIVNDAGSIQAFGRAKDDRVMGTALAMIAWKDQIQQALYKKKVYWRDDIAKAPEEQTLVLPPGVIPMQDIARYLPATLQRDIARRSR